MSTEEEREKRREYMREWRKKNPDKVKKYNEWNKENYWKKYYNQHKEERKAYARNYIAKKAKEERAKREEYNNTHDLKNDISYYKTTKKYEYDVDYVDRNRDRINAYHREWIKKYREKKRREALQNCEGNS